MEDKDCGINKESFTIKLDMPFGSSFEELPDYTIITNFLTIEEIIKRYGKGVVRKFKKRNGSGLKYIQYGT